MIQSPHYWLLLLFAVPLYWLVPHRVRMALLAVVSIAFVASVAPEAAIALGVLTATVFFVAPLARGDRAWARWVVPALLAVVLAHLAHHKYMDGVVTALGLSSAALSVAIPLGISYFTFKLAHYAIEVGRGNVRDRSLATFACYMFLFPIYSAGPIERFDHFLANRSESFERDHLVSGGTRIVQGLIKKLVIGEILIRGLYGEFDSTSSLLEGMDSATPTAVWRFLLCSYLLIYMDFSGYSDIAIGSSRLFGIRVMENFRWPIFAANIGDFWKRWHMTLAGWCQAYVYMPMIGLTRRPYLAVFATFIAMGLWHAGAWAWVLWGVYHAAGVSVYLTWLRVKRKRRWLKSNPFAARLAGTVVTTLFVSASFTFTFVHGHAGVSESLRILARAIGIHV